MSNLDQIVTVNITSQTTGLATKNFSVGMLLSSSAIQRAKEYSALTEVSDDYATTDAEYLFANAYFTQTPRAGKMVIGGHAHILNFSFGTGTYTAGDISATVNGSTTVTVSFTTDKDTTLAALAAAIQALSDVSTAVYATNVITVTPASNSYAGVTFDLSAITGTMEVAAPTTAGEQETITEALDAVNDINSSWYGVSNLNVATAVNADLLLMASWCVANKKFMFTASAETNIKAQDSVTDSTTIAYLLNNQVAPKTALFFNDEVRSQVSGEEILGYVDATFMSNILARTVGSYTTVYKELTNVSVDDLSSNQQSNIDSKNTNYYITIAGRKSTMGGRVTDGNAKGEWIDTVIGIDLLEARLQEAVFLLLANNDKIPYTDSGAAQIEGEVRSVLSQQVDSGFLASFTTELEPVADQSEADRLQRIYNGCSFQAVLAGAIHTVTINGTVRV